MGNAILVIGSTGGQIKMSESIAVAGASGYGQLYISSADKELHLVNSDGIDEAVGGGSSGELVQGAADGSLYTPNVGAAAMNVGSVGSIAIGKNADSNQFGDAAIGSIAIGDTAQTYNIEAISIGKSSVARQRGVAIGAASYSNTGIAIGYQTSGDGSNCISLGHSASTQANYGIAIGTSAKALNYGNSGTIAIGGNAQATHNGSAVLGYNLVSVVENVAHVEALHIKTVGVYADNAAAIVAGLTGGQVYRTATGQLMITY